MTITMGGRVRNMYVDINGKKMLWDNTLVSWGMQFGLKKIRSRLGGIIGLVH